MNYEQWNSSLRDYFFNSEMAGREVILFVDSSLINKVGSTSRSDVNDFINAIKRGPEWSTKVAVSQKAYDSYIKGKTLGYAKPQYIAYLAFFVLAAGTEGDFADNAYYPRINQLIGDTSHPITSQNFQKMHELWGALEAWTKEEMYESVGRFTARIRGRWVHVGMPWSQTLLTSEERAKLPLIFSEYGFDPTSPPGENVVARSLLQSAEILPRTRRVIQNQEVGGGHFRQSLLELVVSDLRDWNGEVPVSVTDTTGKNTSIFGSVRVCLDYDPVAQRLHSTLRFKTNRDLPEEEIYYIRQRDKSLWACTSSIESWTTEFYCPSSRNLLDASVLNWDLGETFTDESGQWKVQLSSSEAKLFMAGVKEGLSKWVETNRLQPGERFLLAVKSNQKERVSMWGSTSCQTFKELRVTEGLPKGWTLFELSNVTKSHPTLELLQLPTSVSIRFIGGIRTRPGNKYFPFALPKIAIDGFAGDDNVIVHGRRIPRGKDGFWNIPMDLPKEQPISVEVPVGDRVYKGSLQLEDSSFCSEYTSLSRDKFGRLQEFPNPDCSISGAVVDGNIISSIPSFKPALPTFLAHRMILLGNQPGEICKWPEDGLPRGWEPVWAVIKLRRDKYQAIYVGSNNEPPDVRTMTKLYQWKKWKKTFLYRDVLPPKLKSLVGLWNAYKKEAKRL